LLNKYGAEKISALRLMVFARSLMVSLRGGQYPIGLFVLSSGVQYISNPLVFFVTPESRVAMA
jgi:hypothetical protein